MKLFCKDTVSGRFVGDCRGMDSTFFNFQTSEEESRVDLIMFLNEVV